MATTFTKLNQGWNAEPNAPDPHASVDGTDVLLEFLASPVEPSKCAGGRRVRLRFRNASRYRLGGTNDEGWYRGQCRFSGIAPNWGEFYEIAGDLKLDVGPDDWTSMPNSSVEVRRHFLFYLRDETFECTASDWTLEEAPFPRGG